MSDAWPELPYPAWRETKDTLHMFTQVVGKLKLELCPFLNQWWEVAFGLTARGLGTGPIPHGEASFDVEFDLVTHRVVVRHSDGAENAPTIVYDCQDRRQWLAPRPSAVRFLYSQFRQN